MRAPTHAASVHVFVAARPSASSHLSARALMRPRRHSGGQQPPAASRQEFQISVQKLQATSSASAERKSPLFKDSWLLQEHILFQIVMFGQFTLFIRFEINGSQSRRKVNKCLQKVLSHATRLARPRRWGPLVCGKRVKEAQRRFSQGLCKK